MARTRLLHPEFFKHEDLAKLPALHRLLFQGLWTICDREGRLEDRPQRIKVDTLPYDDCDVDEMLSDLDGAGFIRRYTVDGKRYVVIPSFPIWNKPHPKEPGSKIPSPEIPRQDTTQPGNSTALSHISKRLDLLEPGNSTASPEIPRQAVIVSSVSKSVSKSVSNPVSKSVSGLETDPKIPEVSEFSQLLADRLNFHGFWKKSKPESIEALGRELRRVGVAEAFRVCFPRAEEKHHEDGKYPALGYYASVLRDVSAPEEDEIERARKREAEEKAAWDAEIALRRARGEDTHAF